MKVVTVPVRMNVEHVRQVAEAVQWFAGRLSAAADELLSALDDVEGADTK